VCNAKGRGSAWRILVVIAMVLWPTMIAVSRTADYHHHWQGKLTVYMVQQNLLIVLI